MITRTIRSQEDVNPKFPEEVAALPGGEALRECIQCGTCSGTCPVSVYMDYTPRRLIALAREGFERDVLSSRTIWLCTSCYACTVRCPAGIKITDIMYAFKRLAIKKGYKPKQFPTAVLSELFFKEALSAGRVADIGLAIKFVLKTNPFKGLSMSGLGLKLMSTGRLHLTPEKVKNIRQLKEMVKEAMRNA